MDVIEYSNNLFFLSTEFCDSEKFQAECMDDEVVVITHAKYGRHRVGKCVAKDYGNLGCVSDVIYAVDSLCSGLQRCEFEVDDDTFASYHPCPKDFKAHLLVAYQCVRGKCFKLICFPVEVTLIVYEFPCSSQAYPILSGSHDVNIRSPQSNDHQLARKSS